MQDNVLDLEVARAVMRLRQIERALHDSGPWQMCANGVTVPATRFIRADRISFVSHFPPMCPLDHEPERPIVLLCRGEEVAVRTEALHEDGCEVWWDLALADAPAPVT